jgi:hypothetical protein
MDDVRITPGRAEPGQKELSTTQSRAGTTEGVTRWVLIGGLVLVVVLFAALYKVFF